MSDDDAPHDGVRVALRLSPLAPDDARALGMPGLTIHWWEPEPTVPSRRRHKLPSVGPTPRYVRVPFSALRDDRRDLPPSTTAEARRYALLAYAVVAAHHPIPSDADVRYEVCHG